MEETPGNCPAKELVTLALGDFSKASVPTLDIAPVNVAFFCTPYATTITSSRLCTFSCKHTLIPLREFTFISCDW